MLGLNLTDVLVGSILSPRPVDVIRVIRRRPLIIEKTRTIVVEKIIFVDKKKEKKTVKREIPVE